MMTIIEPRPQGVVDWTVCVCMVVLAVPVLATFGPVVWLVRTCDRVAGKVGA